MKINLIRIRSLITTFGIVLISLSFAAAQGKELSGTKWQLTQVNGQAVHSTRAVLEFNSDRSRFSGNAGCNRMFGDVEVNGRQIDFGALGLTKMACADTNASRTERAYTKALDRVNRFRRSGSTLELLDYEKVVLKFKALSETGGDLESKKWVLDAIGGTPVHVKGTMPFIVFDSSKSSAGGNTGCNSFGGSYGVSGRTIRIFDTISTMRACIEDNRMTVERQFLDALQNADRFEIKGGKLYLYRKSNILASFIAENRQ